MSAAFLPVWTPASGTLISSPQGEEISLQLSVQESLVVTLPAGTFQLQGVGDSLDRIDHVFVGNDEIGFTADQTQGELTFGVLPYDSTVTVYRQPTSKFILLNGRLPNGLRLFDDGSIRGTAEHIYPDNQTFAFTVRAQNEFAVRDRVFEIVITGSTSAAFLNPATLPARVSTPVSACLYGSFQLRQSVAITIDLVQKDFDLPPLRLVATDGLIASSSVFDGLPDGLALVGRQIQGRIAATASPGTYVWTILIDDPVQPSSTVMSMLVEPTHTQSVDVPLLLLWSSQSAALADQTSFLPCCATITAQSNIAPPVYSLSPFSGPLPDGLILDPRSGALAGVPEQVLGSQTFEFTVRATVGFAFVERAFTIRVSSQFDSPDVASFYSVVDPIQSAAELVGIADLVPASVIFHLGDPLFGIQTRPQLRLIEGLALPGSNDLLAVDSTAIGQPNYYYGFHLLTGPLRAVTVADSNGVALYDVILRSLHDPKQGAGGYVLDQNSDVVVQTVIEQSGTSLRTVYTNSIQNIRFDLVDKLGFQSQTPRRFGPSSPELLQAWMGGNYQAALPLIYLLPGMGERYLRILQGSPRVAPVGNRIDINQIFVHTPDGTTLLQLR